MKNDKNEIKNKVGRPRLANSYVIKKSNILIAICLFICLIFSFCFVQNLKGEDEKETIYSLTLGKMFGSLQNKDGFLVNEYYDNNDNYVLEIKASSLVKSTSGDYKYQLYYLKGNKWVLKEEKIISEDKDMFKIIVNSKKNKNVTWKIKLQLKNAAKIEKSYAPSGWSFVDAKNQADKYAYKTFTVKGYYSPVSIKEIKESLKNVNKVNVKTTKKDPRKFILNVPNNTYLMEASYLDSNKKSVLIKRIKSTNKKASFSVPNLDFATNVTINVYVKNAVNKSLLSDLKLSNWDVKEDKTGLYITNTYLLKPEKSYKN